MTEDLNIWDDEAAEWVARMDAGNWTEADEQALQGWLAEAPLRQGALLQAQAAWIHLDRLRPARSQPTGGVHRRALLWGGGGAVAAAAAAAVGFVLMAKQTYATVIGEIRHVPLEDGSVAMINTASAIEVHFERDRRKVVVREGEAWFQVAKDPSRPFVVRAGEVEVWAVGTAFSVRRREGGADVLVTEGVVDAKSSRQSGAKLRLVAGQRAHIGDHGTVQVEPAQPASLQRALAWRQGMIDLSGDPLVNAIGEFNRYNRRQLVLTDAGLSGEQLDGTFRVDDPEGFANAVKYALNVPVDTSHPDQIKIGKNHK